MSVVLPREQVPGQPRLKFRPRPDKETITVQSLDYSTSPSSKMTRLYNELSVMKLNLPILSSATAKNAKRVTYAVGCPFVAPSIISYTTSSALTT